MTPIDELTRALTADEVLERLLATIEAGGLPARSWRKAGVARSILRVVAILFAGFTVIMAAFVRAGHLETSEGVWLTRLAFYVYGVTRRAATFASGPITLENNGVGFFDEPPGTVRIKSKVTLKEYVNTEQVTITPGQKLPFSFEAVEIGSASSAAVGTEWEFVTQLVGVEITNDNAIAGIDEELDPELRQACRDKVSTRTIRGGPRGAYRYAVREARRPNGAPVNINRTAVSKSSSKGIVDVHVASPSGTPEATDLEYIADSIETHARPDGVTANVHAALAITATRDLIVWAYRTDGVSADDLKTLVANAILRQTVVYPLGGVPKAPSVQGYFYADRISGMVQSAHASIFDVDGIGEDVPLNAGQFIQLTVSITVRLVEAEAA